MSHLSDVTRTRPTFKVAHLFRCHDLIERETFLWFQKNFDEIVSNIENKKENGPELWKYVRSLFDYDDFADCVSINSANLGIIFHPVQQTMNKMATNWNRNNSIQKRKEPFVYTIDAARKLIASQVNAESAHDIAILRNGSDPNGNISNGLDFKEGETVVLWDENHPTNSEVAWKIRQQRFPQIKIVVVHLSEPLDDESIVNAFMEPIKANITKLVSFSEVSHLSGTFLPARMLCDAIHHFNRDIHVHVDGAQSWGVTDHDVITMGCDSFSGGAHKWFLGPKETGFMYMTKKAAQRFYPKDIGYDGQMNPPPEPPAPLAPNAARFEMIGQRNDTNLIGLLYAADLMGLIGFDKIMKRVRFLTQLLRKKLEEILGSHPGQFRIETPNDYKDQHRFLGILVLVFNQPDGTGSIPLLSEYVYVKLYEDYKIALSTKKGNRLRFSPHIYNTEEHIIRCVDAVNIELDRFKQKYLSSS